MDIPEPRRGRPRALTPDQEAEARQLAAEGATLRELAHRYGISWSSIRRALLRGNAG